MSHSGRSVIEDVISLTWGWTYERLPAAVVEEAKKAILDTIGVAVMGFEREERVKRFASLALPNEMGSLVLGGWWRTSPSMAALVNGFAAHALEYDDWLRPGFVHAGSAVIPAALAVGEGRVSWRMLIESIAAGYEVAARFGRAFGRSHYAVWHTTATAGSLGAAAAASKVLGLDEEGASNAVAIATYYSSGLWGFIESGSDVKPFSPAHAAFLGVVAAKMAENGVRTNLKAIEGERGFCGNMAPECDLDSALRPGWDFAIVHNGYKFFPACRHAHTAIYAALVARESVLDIGEVEVEVFEEAVRVAGIRRPKTVDQARFSLSYLVAAAIVYGRLGLDELERGLSDRRVMRLEEAVMVKVNGELSQEFPRSQPAIVRIRGDSTAEERVDYPPGDPENPASLDQIYRKLVHDIRAAPVISRLYRTLSVGDMEGVVEVV